MDRRPEQNGRYFADGISKCIFFQKNGRISIKIILKFIPVDRIDKSALLRVITWR